MKIKLLVLTAISVSFFTGMTVDKLCITSKETVGKTSPEWAFLDPYELWSKKKRALRGDHDTLASLLRFYRFSMEDERQRCFWARIGAKNGDVTCEEIIRNFDKKHKNSIRENVSLEQHFLDGGLGDDVIEAFERREALKK